MQPRIDGPKIAPGGYKAMLGLEAYLHESGLEDLSSACQGNTHSR